MYGGMCIAISLIGNVTIDCYLILRTVTPFDDKGFVPVLLGGIEFAKS